MFCHYLNVNTTFDNVVYVHLDKIDEMGYSASTVAKHRPRFGDGKG